MSTLNEVAETLLKNAGRACAVYVKGKGIPENTAIGTQSLLVLAGMPETGINLDYEFEEENPEHVIFGFSSGYQIELNDLETALSKTLSRRNLVRIINNDSSEKGTYFRTQEAEQADYILDFFPTKLTKPTKLQKNSI